MKELEFMHRKGLVPINAPVLPCEQTPKHDAGPRGSQAEFCNHRFRGTGMTIFLINGGSLEAAQDIANHADRRWNGLLGSLNPLIAALEKRKSGAKEPAKFIKLNKFEWFCAVYASFLRFQARRYRWFNGGGGERWFFGRGRRSWCRERRRCKARSALRQRSCCGERL